MRIEPTVGRVVWYYPEGADRGPHPGEQPLSAQIAHVNEDGTVNLGVLDSLGVHFSKQNVVLIQDGDERPDGCFAEWMPYQKGQAAKTEQLEDKLAASSDPEGDTP
jgi:hypothetical protein